MKFSNKCFGACFGAVLLVAITTHAQTQYTWTGGTSTDWNTAANWSGGSIFPTGNLVNSVRLNVQNAANNTCTYTAAQGYTTVANLGTRALVIGSGTSGSMVINGGTWESQLGADDAVGNVAASGTLTIAGGNYIFINGTGPNTLDVNVACTGANGGTLNINSGSATVNTILLGANASAVGYATINLNGGTLAIGAMKNSGSATCFATNNFNGGVLQALASKNIIFGVGKMTVNVLAGGAIVDSQAFNITNVPPLLNRDGGTDGGLTKLGSGSLVCLGTNTYNGPTTISSGTLAINAQSSGGGAYTNSANTALQVSVPGVGSQLKMASWSLADQCTNIFDLGTFGNPTIPVIYATNLYVAGTTYVNISAPLGLRPGQFAVIQYRKRYGIDRRQLRGESVSSRRIGIHVQQRSQ